MASVELEPNFNNSSTEGNGAHGVNSTIEVPPSSQRSDAGRVFKKRLLQEFDWLASIPGDPTHALCKICNKKVKPFKSDFKRHQNTKCHLRKQAGKDTIAERIPSTDDEGLSSEEDVSPANQTRLPRMDSAAKNVSQLVDYDSSDPTLHFGKSSPTQNTTTTVLINDSVEYHETRIKELEENHQIALSILRRELDVVRRRAINESIFRRSGIFSLYEQQNLEGQSMTAEHMESMKAIRVACEKNLQAIEEKQSTASQEHEKKMELLEAELRHFGNLNISPGPK